HWGWLVLPMTDHFLLNTISFVGSREGFGHRWENLRLRYCRAPVGQQDRNWQLQQDRRLVQYTTWRLPLHSRLFLYLGHNSSEVFRAFELNPGLFQESFEWTCLQYGEP